MPAGLGIVATGAAYLNYRGAKRDYDNLVEKRDGLLSAVKMFNSGKDEDYIKQLEREYTLKYKTSYPDDVKCRAILRTSYLVGKVFRCVASVVFSNLGDKTYEIGNVSAECWVQDVPVIVKDIDYALANLFTDPTAPVVPQSTDAKATLKPCETLEVSFHGGISAVPDMGALRQMVCDAAGKKLVTSCPKISIEDGIKANIAYRWREVGEKDWHRAEYKQLNGVFRYCMELPLYANS